MNKRIAFIGCLILGLVAPPGLSAKEPKAAAVITSSSDGKVDFLRDIQPILANQCHDCHGPDAQEGWLRLDAKRIVLAGGVSGPRACWSAGSPVPRKRIGCLPRASRSALSRSA